MGAGSGGGAGESEGPGTGCGADCGARFLLVNTSASRAMIIPAAAIPP